jgi:hypothetical protein
MAANNNNGFFEVSIDVASAQVEVTRDDNDQIGPLLDHPSGSGTVNLQRMWMFLRLVFATFLVVSGIGIIVVTAMEWNTATRCSIPIKSWLLVQAVCQLVAVPLSFLSRYLIGRQGRARTCRVVSFALVARLMNLFLFAWFIVGMVWLVASFNTNYKCHTEVPLMWYSMMLFLMVEMIAVFVAVVGLAFSCITLAARMILMANGGAGRGDIGGRRGASAEEITEHSDLRRFSANMFADVEDAKCVVCLGEYEEGDELRYLRCQHHFHKVCLLLIVVKFFFLFEQKQKGMFG